jgi:ubiquinone/menaquinone biosynthesis C-methylase UbiE
VTSSREADSAYREQQRVLAEYERREREIDQDRYAPWRASVLLRRATRARDASRLLRAAGVFPRAGWRCLEVGFGKRGGWLADLLVWGVSRKDLCGIDLDIRSVAEVSRKLGASNLAVGDGAFMPWPDGAFQLVIASTVFSSILDDHVRQTVSGEISRVLASGGALLWYDFRVSNPRNANVRGVRRRELLDLFPGLKGEMRSVTLAPPLADLVAPRSWMLATLLETIPPLRTHWIAVLRKAS